MPCLRLSLLGSLQVMVENAPITTFGSDKARALLVYLAVETDRPHRRDELIGLLWPDCPEETARHNLRQTLLNIRRAIGDHTAKPPYLLITRDEIRFNTASDCALDVAAFNAHLAGCNAHKHQERKTCAECAARIQQAVELYRGKFLQQFFLGDSAEFEEWALIQREALHRRALETLAHLTDYHEQCADYERARRYATRQLELDPWREEAHRQMMRVLASSGERSAALLQYETCRRVLADELGVEPSMETRELYEKIRNGSWNKTRTSNFQPPTPNLQLPTQLTPFVGRKCELADLGQLITDPQCRLITLVGIGGIGKTRLALQAAAQQRETFAHDAAFIPLASVGSAESIIPAIADALGFVFSGPSDPRVQLLHYLRDKQMLLVLDNIEHLLDGAGLFVEILQHAPAVKLLCTSRESLHVQSEWVFEVEGLGVPADEQTEAFENYGAVALFIQHARRARVGYALTSKERFGVARICQLVGGTPLALELAATWARTLSSREIADQIERNVDFLATSMRDLPERHRSMRAVFDQSWGMLTAEERLVLSKSSVFRGGFQFQAAEQVAGASLSVLASLVTKSLVRRMENDRYDMHELIRQYAVAQLGCESPEYVFVRNQHCAYFSNWLANKWLTLISPNQRTVLAEITIEIDNVRQAWEWAITHERIDDIYESAHTLYRFYQQSGWIQEGTSMFKRAFGALSRSPDQPSATPVSCASVRDVKHLAALGRTSQACGQYLYSLGQMNESIAWHEQSISVLQGLDDIEARRALADAYLYLGITLYKIGDQARAYHMVSQGLEISRAINYSRTFATCLVSLGVFAQAQDEHTVAYEQLKEGLSVARVVGDPSLLGWTLSYASASANALGKSAEAQQLVRDALTISRANHDRWNTATALNFLGVLMGASESQNRAEGLEHLRESVALFDEAGTPWNKARALRDMGQVALSLGQMDEAQSSFREAFEIAMAHKAMPLALDVLTGMATLWQKRGETEHALQIVVRVLDHPALAQETKNRAEKLLTELETQHTREQVEAAKVRAQAKTLEMVTQEILTTLAS